jgi:adenosine deaminase
MPGVPRADLHRHLEGSIRLATVLEIALRWHQPLPAEGLTGLRRAVYMTQPSADILDIMPRFDLLRQALVDLDACRRVTLECIEDAACEGLAYVELRFSPLFMAEPHHLDPMSVTAAVCEAWQEAHGRWPIESRLIVILSRTYGPQQCQVELEAALAYRSRGVVGLDLAGDEARWPARLFAGHFRRAKEAGLRLTAHAGEFAGAESVRQTILELGVERLGHAVHAVDAPEVMDLIAEREITIECCPTSNVFTYSVPSLAAHPLPLFLEKGLKVCLNVDDPTLFGEIGLEHEERLVQQEMGITRQQIEEMRQIGLKAAFLG